MRYKYYEIGKKMRYLETPKPLTEDELKTFLDGNYSFVALTDGTVACVNEDGVIRNLPLNPAIKPDDTEVDIDTGLRGNIIIGKEAHEEFVGID